jgi:RNA polymerase sigma-70 factor (ECF subfamily)
MEVRDRFMELVEGVRPELHRYCARMTGSVIDGEDVVQDTLARAYYALSQMMEPPNLRPWLFRIAHNAAMDFLKRADRRYVELVEAVPERAELDERAVDPELVEAALAVFVELPPVQRSAIVLKDVLGHTLEEVATTMGTTVGAVKAALWRARANIARAPRPSHARIARTLTPEEEAVLRRYVNLFNDRDWVGLRALLGEESRLEIVSRIQRRALDAGYYDRYAEITKTEDLRAELGVVDGLPAIAVFRLPDDAAPAYFMVLDVDEGAIARIRDFRYIPYIARGATFLRA